MKSSKRIIKDYQLVGTPGLPVNNFSGAQYLSSSVWTGLGLSTTTLYGWRAGASGFTTVQGAENLTEQGTLGVATDHLGSNVDCYFTGSQYLNNTSASFNFTGTFSLSFWIYVKDPQWYSGNPMIIARNNGANGWIVQFENSSICVFCGVNTFQAGTREWSTLTDGWHHVSIVRTDTGTNTGTTSIYIDGIKDISTNICTDITAAGNLEIGSYNVGAQKFKGKITDVWIHNATAWTDAQVMAIYTASLPNHTHDQQFAGHVPNLTEPGTTSAEVLNLFPLGANGGNILVDLKTGANDLVNNGAALTASGLFGEDNGSVVFNGSTQYLTHPTALDVAVSKGIAIDFWIKPGKGFQASSASLVFKSNAGADYLQLAVSNSPYNLFFRTGSTAQGQRDLYTLKTFSDNGSWCHIVLAWDAVYGKRIFIDGVLDCQDAAATGVMSAGTNGDFGIARTIGYAYYLPAQMTMVRIRDKILTQQDVDVAYSTRYDKSVFPDNTLTELSVNAKNEVMEWQTNFPMIAQDNNYIYRRGYTPEYGLRSGHQLQIKGGY